MLVSVYYKLLLIIVSSFVPTIKPGGKLEVKSRLPFYNKYQDPEHDNVDDLLHHYFTWLIFCSFLPFSQ
jgi:hypothetical protein